MRGSGRNERGEVLHVRFGSEADDGCPQKRRRATLWCLNLNA